MFAAVPAIAAEMTAEEARGFVVGKLFTYNCFEGTRGAGRVHSDGSVIGTVQFRGSGPVRNAFLPAGTLRVNGSSVCASLRGLPFEPCFNLERVDANTFRGSVSGIGFASCEFTRRGGRINVAARDEEAEPVHESARAHVLRRHRATSSPLALRPTIDASAQ